MHVNLHNVRFFAFTNAVREDIIKIQGTFVRGRLHIENIERRMRMGCLGNFLWFICGGLVSGLTWAVAGCLWCITIVGIPIGKQCFKFAGLSFFPFGKDVDYGGGVGSLIVNIIWLIVTGLPLALEHAVFGAVMCITIVGIPFGLQHFKLAKLALMPFGARVR